MQKGTLLELLWGCYECYGALRLGFRRFGMSKKNHRGMNWAVKIIIHDWTQLFSNFPWNQNMCSSKMSKFFFCKNFRETITTFRKSFFILHIFRRIPVPKCGNYGTLLSLLFGKKFVKVTSLWKRWWLSKWSDEIFVRW